MIIIDTGRCHRKIFENRIDNRTTGGYIQIIRRKSLIILTTRNTNVILIGCIPLERSRADNRGIPEYIRINGCAGIKIINQQFQFQAIVAIAGKSS